MTSHGTPVQHIEGTSYAVAFGDPENNSLSANHPLASRTASFAPYPAAGGLNPYDPERGSMALVIDKLRREPTGHTPTLSELHQGGASLSVCVYDILSDVPEESRGINPKVLLKRLITTGTAPLLNMYVTPPRTEIIGAFVVMCLFRCCYHNSTVTAFADRPGPYGAAGPGQLFEGMYFNLSARERTRLREYAKAVRRDRRMPYIPSRQLILRKASSGGGPFGRFIRRNYLPDSDDLFRVVVSFL